MATSPKARSSELRMKQCNVRELSPDRVKGSRIIEQKPKMPKKVQVLYYLSRNGQLEHPHFMEITMSSNDGLYLRDVLNRLNALRGKGMPYLFSWSSKRSYKNGYVWHDLAEDDLIFPTHGNDYVLKGSELLEGSTDLYKPIHSGKLSTSKTLVEGPMPARYQDAVSSNNKTLVIQKPRVNSVNTGECRIERTDSRERTVGSIVPIVKMGNVEGELYNRENMVENVQNFGHGSEEYHMKKTSYGGESSWSTSGGGGVGEYKVYKTEQMACIVDQGADAATQTEERRRVRCTKGVSTEEDDECNSSKNSTSKESHSHEEQKPTELSGMDVSPPPSSSGSPGSPNSKIKPNNNAKAEESFRSDIMEEETYIMPIRPRASTILMQLISCGSIAVKDHGFVTAFRSNKSFDGRQVKAITCAREKGNGSKRIVIEDELDCMSDNPHFARLQIQEKEYFSGSFVETKTEKEAQNVGAGLKRSASYNADRSSSSDLVEKPKDEDNAGVRTKCVPRKMKSSKQQQPKSSFLRTPTRFAKMPSKLGRSPSGLPTKADATDKSSSIDEKDSQKSELFRDDNSKTESFRTSFKENSNPAKQFPCASSESNTTLQLQETNLDAGQDQNPTIELRQYLEECRSAEAVANAAKETTS